MNIKSIRYIKLKQTENIYFVFQANQESAFPLTFKNIFMRCVIPVKN